MPFEVCDVRVDSVDSRLVACQCGPVCGRVGGVGTADAGGRRVKWNEPEAQAVRVALVALALTAWLVAVLNLYR